MRVVARKSDFVSESRRRKRDGEVAHGMRKPERSFVSMPIPAVFMGLVFAVLVRAIPSEGFTAVSPVAASAISPSQLYENILSEEDCVEQQLGYLPSNYVGVSAWKKMSEGSSHRSGVQIDASIADTNTIDEEGNSNVMIPVAIQTYPLNGGAKRRQNKAKLPADQNEDHDKPESKKKSIVQSPFPTLFWLTCPDISKAVANLERRGFVQIFEDELNANPELSQRLFSCHEEYADLRWRSLTEEDRNILKSSSNSSLSPSLQRMRNMMECSGISGTNFTDISSWDSDYSERLAAAATVVDTTQTSNGDNEEVSSLPLVVPKVPPIKCLHAHYAHYRSTVSAESTRYINPVGELIHKRLQMDFPDLDL